METCQVGRSHKHIIIHNKKCILFQFATYLMKVINCGDCTCHSLKIMNYFICLANGNTVNNRTNAPVIYSKFHKNTYANRL